MPDQKPRAVTLEELKAAEPPMLGADGRTTLEHLRWKAQVVNRLMVDAALGVTDLPKGYNAAQARDLIDTEARLCGYDPRHLLDVRTEAQVYADATETLLASPAELFAQTDTFLDRIESGMAAADGHLQDICGQSGMDAHTKRRSVEHEKHLARVEEAKKVWRERIARLRRVRERARDAFPKGSPQPDRCALAASHVLRFMVYVGRNEDGGVPVIGSHHGQLALAFYEAEFRRNWREQERDWVDFKYTGVVGVLPPGHGKTFFAAHWCGLRLAQNPRLRGGIAHAQSGEAEKNLAFVSAMFSADTAQGRRLRSLFPGLPGVRKSITDVFDFESTGDEQKRQPTLVAFGITAKVNGSDFDFLWLDDICDQEIAEQETTRKRVFDRMNGTIRRRLREKPSSDGHWPFDVTTTTLWHHQDPNAIRIQLAREKKIKVRVKMMACGGPEHNFKPVWPEVYSASKLRAIYAEMRNPRLYAATYQCNPQPESLRKIKKLAYYLPGAKGHAAFMASSINYISIDPAGTNQDKSDMASYVYGACGDLVVSESDGSVQYVRKLRLIDGREIHARQNETVSEVCAFAERQSTHYILCELVSGYEAMREFFEQRGIDVIESKPSGKSKSIRLGHVAPMIDDDLRSKGFPGAVVEFPGRLMEDGVTVGPDPDSPLAWLEDQVLNFGVARGDHGVDALVYLAKHLGPELSVAEGAVTRTLQARGPRHPDSRIDRMLDYYGTDPCQRTTAEQEDHEFMLGVRREEP